MNYPTALSIGTKELAELQEIALKCPIDTRHLSHTETQQVLVLYSLQQFFTEHGLSVDFTLKIEKAK